MWIDVVVNESEIMKMLETIFKPFQVHFRTKGPIFFVFESFRKSTLIFDKHESGNSIILHCTAEILSDIDVRGLFQDFADCNFFQKDI